jgi:hypothetical protein
LHREWSREFCRERPDRDLAQRFAVGRYAHLSVDVDHLEAGACRGQDAGRGAVGNATAYMI